MPNRLRDVLPGKGAQPGQIVNCTRETGTSHVSVEGAGWQRAWPAVLGLASFYWGRDTEFPTFAHRHCHWVWPCAFGQWNMRGGAALKSC